MKLWSTVIWGPIIVVVIRTYVLITVLSLAGCSLTVGGAKFCFLDHADLTVTTHHEHADPNAH